MKDKPEVRWSPIAGKPILEHILDAYRSANVRDLVVVRGFAKEAVDLPGATLRRQRRVRDDRRARLARDARRRRSTARASSRTATSLFKKYVLDELLETEGDFVVAVDSMPAQDDAAEAAPQGRLGDLLRAALAQDAPRATSCSRT